MIVFSRLSKGVISERGKLIHCQPLESMTKVDEGQEMSRAHQRARSKVITRGTPREWITCQSGAALIMMTP